MNKKFCFSVFVLFLSLILTTGVWAAPWVNLRLTYDYTVHNYNAEAVYIKINGLELEGLEMPPIIMNNFTLVPAREVLETLGAVVDWKKETEEIYIAYEDDITIIKINSNNANCNGVIKEMPVPFKIINNKTMVPVRFISEAFGFGVNWVNDERTIYINSPEKIEPDLNLYSENEISSETVSSSDESASTNINNDSSSEILNQNSSNEEDEASLGVIGGADGPTSIYINSNSLSEIDFSDDFYYDRNMRNLIISSSCVSGGIDGVSELESGEDKKHYFSVSLAPGSNLSSGYYNIGDENIIRIDFLNNDGEMLICFNEKSSVSYKVYEEQGYIYIKPFT